MGTSFFKACAGRQGAGLRLWRRGEHQETSEKMPAGHRQGHRLFARQRGESKKVNEAAIAEGRCAVLQGSVADMMFADNWFDAVTAFETVYFWPNLPRCFREVSRVLKPGGTFLICNESNGDTDKDEKWTEIIGGMTIYKDTQLKAYLEQVGFHEVQIHKKKGWLCVTARK
jgi:ubiquinone/menaquinone biosynthesis C-methylase UbiE